MTQSASTQPSVADCRRQAEDFLVKGRQHLVEEDVLQASEKGCCGVRRRKWLKRLPNRAAGPTTATAGSTASFGSIVRSLVAETGDTQIFTLFQVASGLHRNFCEDWQPLEMVQAGLDDIEQFLVKLQPLTGTEGAPSAGKRPVLTAKTA